VIAVLVVAAFAIVLARVVAPSFTWNLSASLPRGLYRLDPSAPPRLDAIVSFAPPPSAVPLITARRYLAARASLLKRVVALPGDTVCVGDSFVANGRLIGAVSRHDSAGRALTPYLFCGAVPPDSAFVATSAALSFDSRYFGPVVLSSLTVAVPVWTY
jgi:conjugative transfer signal peptidase TraF